MFGRKTLLAAALAFGATPTYAQDKELLSTPEVVATCSEDNLKSLDLGTDLPPRDATHACQKLFTGMNDLVGAFNNGNFDAFNNAALFMTSRDVYALYEGREALSYSDARLKMKRFGMLSGLTGAFTLQNSQNLRRILDAEIVAMGLGELFQDYQKHSGAAPAPKKRIELIPRSYDL